MHLYGRTDSIAENQHEDVIATHQRANVRKSSLSAKLHMQTFKLKGHNDTALKMLEALEGRKLIFGH